MITPPPLPPPPGGEPGELVDLVVAPGYQAVLLPGRPGRTVRWRSVRRDGTRFPLVGELGVVIAQAKTLAGVDGRAWIVGSDHHAIEIHHHPSDLADEPPGSTGTQRRKGFTVHGCGPRWTHTVQRALTS